MFERFEPEARRAVIASQETARELGRASIGTEHLLAGLMDEEWFTSAQILTALGATSSDIHHAIGARPAGPPPRGLGPHVPLDPAVKRVLKRAVEEAERLGVVMVGTGHLLLALLHERRSRGAQILEGVGVSYAVAAETLRTIPKAPRSPSDRRA